jgi:hypothetical protein
MPKVTSAMMMSFSPFSTNTNDAFMLSTKNSSQGAAPPLFTVLDTWMHQHDTTVETLVAGIGTTYGTPVVVLNKFTKPIETLLKSLGLMPGFVSPQATEAFEALRSVLAVRYPVLRTAVAMEKGVFIVPYTFNGWTFWAHQLYHWMAFNEGMEGYTQDAYRLYRELYLANGGTLPPAVLEGLPLETLKALKANMQREREALEYMQHQCHLRAVTQLVKDQKLA